MKFILLIILLSLVLPACKRAQPESHPHFHAGFQVYRDGQLQDFTDLKYMHLESCVELSQDDPPQLIDEQIEKAHLHDGIGDVVHIHRQGSLWSDLFNNLNYPLSASVSAFLNGQLTSNFLTLPINPYDVLIVIQNHIASSEAVLVSAPTKDYILAIESKSENCGDK